jgi:choline dehydrogenase-like flavoprotein
MDGRTVPEGQLIETDVCVVGAGPAGIAMARQWSGADFRVCLLESGGLRMDAATDDLTEGEVTGFPYDRLAGARYRAFGGGSHTWHVETGDGYEATRLRALDPADFLERPWVPHSGWPFDREHLQPFYERAHELFGIGPVDDRAAGWEDPLERPRLPTDETRVRSTIFQFGRAATFFEEYRLQLHRASNVTTYLNSNVVELDTNEDGTQVESVRVRCLAGADSVLIPSGDGFQRMEVEPLPGSGFRVKARIFVLAAGGTENPRLLLASRRVCSGGIGNQSDLVGRFFMEHPHIWSGWFVPASEAVAGQLGLYRIHPVDGVPIMAKLTLSDRLRTQEELLGHCVSLLPNAQEALPEGVHSFLRMGKALRKGRFPPRFLRHLRTMVLGADDILERAWGRVMKGRGEGGSKHRPKGPPMFRLDHMAEQVPNPHSRVTLSGERDPLGVPRVRLDWRLTAQDIRSMVRSQELLDEELRRAGLGYLLLEMDEDRPPEGLKGGWHHMGTTRMHRDPGKGVVDESGRVHGMDNLYIAGSSVFPTGGYANPTLTLCALAIRLADHVDERLNRR